MGSANDIINKLKSAKKTTKNWHKLYLMECITLGLINSFSMITWPYPRGSLYRNLSFGGNWLKYFSKKKKTKLNVGIEGQAANLEGLLYTAIPFYFSAMVLWKLWPFSTIQKMDLVQMVFFFFFKDKSA